jgi:hypothetical protein
MVTIRSISFTKVLKYYKKFGVEFKKVEFICSTMLRIKLVKALYEQFKLKFLFVDTLKR